MQNRPMSLWQRMARRMAPWAVLTVCAVLTITLVRTELMPTAPRAQSAQVPGAVVYAPNQGGWWQDIIRQVSGVTALTAQTIDAIFELDTVPQVGVVEAPPAVPETQVFPVVQRGPAAEATSLTINVPLQLTDGLQASGVANLERADVSGGLAVSGGATLDSLTVGGGAQLGTLTVSGASVLSTVTAGALTTESFVTERLTATGAVTFESLFTARGGIVTEGATIDVGEGDIFAANIVNQVLAGDNVVVTGTRNEPIISFVPEPFLGVESINGRDGSVTLTGGSGISISGLEIRSTDSLSLVRSRGGCAGCITDGDVIDALTITGGVINNTVIGSTTRAAAYFSELVVGTTTSSTTLTVEGSAVISSSLTVSGNATSTFGGGINILDGCFAVNGVCIDGGDISYLALTDTPDTFVARAVPYVNSAGDGLTQSSTFLFDGTRLGVGTDNLLTTLNIGGSVSALGQGALRLYDADSSNYVALRASTTLAVNTTWSLPTIDGAPDHVITTDGLGNLRFASVGSIGGGASRYIDLTDTPNLLTAYTIPFANATADELVQSSSLVYRDSRLGVGTGNPSQTLTVQGNVRFQVSDVQSGLYYDSAVNRIGFGTTNLVDRVTIQGSLTQRGGTTGSLYSPVVRLNAALPTNAFDIAVQGNYAYVTTGTAGNDFHVFDITNPLTAREVASTSLIAGANGLAVQGNYAYVATDVTGNDFHVIDISNPRTPSEVASVNLPTTATDVAVRGRYAYVTIARNQGALQVIDIGNPLQPFVVGSTTLDAAANAVAIEGDFAYVATNLSGNDFHVINISDPTNPVEVGWLDLPDTANDVVVQGRYAYVVSQADGDDFHIIDIVNPASPVLLGEVEFTTSASGVFVSGRYAYVVTQSDGADLHVIDIIDPNVPVLVGEVDIDAGNAFAVTVQGRYAYVTSGTTGTQFHVIDISGAELQSAIVHTLSGGSLAIQNDGVFGRNLIAGASVQVGGGGIQTVGTLAVSGTESSYIIGALSIGTSTPSAKLTVEGDMRLTGALRDSTNASGTAGYILQSTGSGVLWVATSTLGIGSGITSFLGLTDTPESYGAGRVLFTNATGDGVTDAVGFSFDGTNLTVAASGSYAIGGVGYLSADGVLEALSLGIDAGASNSGIESVFLGDYAGEFNEGSYTTLVGYGSGGVNRGDYVTALGYQAGYENTGVENVLIGRDAGYDMTGSYNLSIGSSAGRQQTGDYSEIIGFEAGRNIQGSSSVIIGSQAFRGVGVDAFAAERNVALGYRAGYTAAAGASNNILIGYQAASNLTTGANNIVIGYNLDLATSTQSESLVIGNLIFGTGLDGTGTTLATGNVGIGTSTPGSRLTVAGYIESTELVGATVDLQTDAQGRIIRGPSDERLKTNISTIEGALDIVLGLRGVRYEWLDTERFGEYVEVGFIAQEVEGVLPEVVRKGGDYWSLNTRNIVAVVVEAVKELWLVVQGNQAEIAALEARVAELEAAQEQPAAAVASSPDGNTSEPVSGTSEVLLPEGGGEASTPPAEDDVNIATTTIPNNEEGEFEVGESSAEEEIPADIPLVDEGEVEVVVGEETEVSPTELEEITAPEAEELSTD